VHEEVAGEEHSEQVGFIFIGGLGYSSLNGRGGEKDTYEDGFLEIEGVLWGSAG